MPSGAKKRKAAKKKQEQASSTPIILKSDNHGQGSTEEDAVRVTDARIEITDSSHDHDKSSSSSSSSDDESHEVKRKDGDTETGESLSEVITVSSVTVPAAGDAPLGSTPNVIVENTGLMDSTTPSDTQNIIEISSVDAIVSNELGESSLPKPIESTALASDESKQASSSTTDSDKKESEVVISHEEETPLPPTHGVAQRTSWLSCCGLFDVMTGSSR